MEKEKYLTIKELQYELKELNLPHSRTYLKKLRLRGAPFIAKRARWSELFDWLKEFEKVQTSASVRK